MISFCSIFFRDQFSITTNFFSFSAVIGGIALILLIRRLSLAIHLRNHGHLIEGQITSTRYTAYGHKEICYCFNFEGKDFRGTKEVVSNIISSDGNIWLVVSPENIKNHVIVDLPIKHSSKIPKDLNQLFKAISDEWKKQLEQIPRTEKIEWTASEPVILKDEGLSFMFKEFKLDSLPIDVEVEDETSKLTIHVNGYAIAICDGLGAWKPTDIYFLDKDTPEEAMEEMRSLRQSEFKNKP